MKQVLLKKGEVTVEEVPAPIIKSQYISSSRLLLHKYGYRNIRGYLLWTISLTKST